VPNSFRVLSTTFINAFRHLIKITIIIIYELFDKIIYEIK
jgi:hypothetical protein